MVDAGIDVARVAAEFPAVPGRTFLNTATMGLMPLCARQAILAAFESRDTFYGQRLLEYFDEFDETRAKAARMIGAHPSDVAYVPSASHALAILLHGIDWKPGDRILTFENEFPNNYYAPAMLAERGVEMKEVPLGEFREHLNTRVRLCLVSALNYITGDRAPLGELRRELSSAGAMLYVDATQGCGGVQLDVREFEPDMMAVHGYKWLLSPTGAGFVYVAPRVREWLQPNVTGWRSDAQWRDFANLRTGAPELTPSAERYEGSMPGLEVWRAMGAVIDLFESLGFANVEAYNLQLAAQLRAGLLRLGFTPRTTASPIVSSRVPGHTTAAELVKGLDREGIGVSSRHGLLRVSVHLYNTTADVERVLRVLATLV